jgi:hypothetical protein
VHLKTRQGEGRCPQSYRRCCRGPHNSSPFGRSRLRQTHHLALDTFDTGLYGRELEDKPHQRLAKGLGNAVTQSGAKCAPSGRFNVTSRSAPHDDSLRTAAPHVPFKAQHGPITNLPCKSLLCVSTAIFTTLFLRF